jgi:hypothetical protein
LSAASPLRFLFGDVVDLGPVGLEVVELPDVLIELRPPAEGQVHRAGQPSLMVDGALAEHHVELGLLRRRAGVGQRGGEALSFDRALGVALDRLGRLDVEQLVDRRDDVYGVDVLGPGILMGLDLRGPGQEAHVGDATLIASPALPVRERGVKRPCPTGVVVVVRSRAPKLVDVGKRQRGGVLDPVKEAPFVEGAVGAPSPLPPLSETTTTRVSSS